MRLTKMLLWGIAGAVGLMVAAGVVWWIFPFLAVDLERLLGSGVLVVLFFCVALGCSAALEKGRAPRLMRSGMTIGAVALAGWITTIWVADLGTSLSWQRSLTWLTAWAGLMLVLGLLLLPDPRRAWWMWLRRSTIVLLCLLGAHICLAMTLYPYYNGWNMYGEFDQEKWQRARQYEEIAFQIGGVLALLAGGGMLFTWLTAALVPPVNQSLSGSAGRTYWLCCPRCGFEQHAMIGPDTCKQCDLRIRVEIA